MGGAARREAVHRSPTRERVLGGVGSEKNQSENRTMKGQKARYHEWF
jgi:hypothetical protein